MHKRLETVRERGTIEGLIRQVAELTATVQVELSRKDRMIKKLLPAAHLSQAENVAQELPVDDEMLHSQSSNDEPLTVDPNLEQKRPICNHKLDRIQHFVEGCRIKKEQILSNDGFISDTRIVSTHTNYTIKVFKKCT